MLQRQASCRKYINQIFDILNCLFYVCEHKYVLIIENVSIQVN